MQLKVYAALVLGLSALSAAFPHSRVYLYQRLRGAYPHLDFLTDLVDDRAIDVGNVFTRPSTAADGYEGDGTTKDKRGIAVGNVFTRPNGDSEENYETPGTDTEKRDYLGVESRELKVGDVLARPNEAV
ncbi:MAG: hypothetical protein M1821_004054 [Bathelium mastoideum]|nr:MAG: hypothetical protein M1821_004054 [Bathelium mastoideum]